MSHSHAHIATTSTALADFTGVMGKAIVMNGFVHVLGGVVVAHSLFHTPVKISHGDRRR